MCITARNQHHLPRKTPHFHQFRHKAVRQLIVKSADETAIKIDRLFNQGSNILNKSIQAEKDTASIDKKTDEIKQVLGIIVQFLKKQSGVSNG
ncbi:MAG: hypothetical protein WCK54_21330 [Desulfuromonadales bacterium]